MQPRNIPFTFTFYISPVIVSLEKVFPDSSEMKFVLATLVIVCGSYIDGEYIEPGPKYPCPGNRQLLYPCECTKGSDQGLYIVCENTNLARLSVGFSNLASLDYPVEQLIISHSQIGRIFGELFYSLAIRKLTIKQTPLQLIESKTFLGVNRTLQELHIIDSLISKFPTSALQDLGNLTVLEIDGNLMEELPNDAFSKGMFGQRLEVIRITGSNIRKIPVAVLAPCKRVKKLYLHHNKIEALERQQFRGLRDLEMLDLSHNNLTKLDVSHFSDLNKLAWCNFSHNSLTDLPRGVFARNSVLKSLNLGNNLLTKLDANTFRGMRFIRRLYLNDNRIRSVGRGTFGSISRIGTIDLARNKIPKIDFQMFHELQYVELIDVSENVVTEIEKLAFKDLYLVHINLSHNAISKIEAEAFINCANITKLDLSHNELTSISAKSFDENTYATELHLAYNRLTDLSQVPLANMTGIKVLNVTNNKLVRIPRNTFPRLYELHTIDVSHNEISEIANAVFQYLFGLRHLNLSYNALERINGATFGSIPTLLSMDLRNNQLNDISPSALTKLTSLRTLSVHNNSLSSIFQVPISLSYLDYSENLVAEIPAKAWPSMNSLLQLNLSRNLLGDSLHSDSFTNLLTLADLDLSDNEISTAPWESLQSVSSLQRISLKNNLFEELGRSSFGTMPVLLSLDLSNNQIKNISRKAFNGLLQLLSLNLTNNDIDALPNGAFQGLVALMMLDLSHNKLEALDNKTHGLFDDCLSLEKLNLSYNSISFVTRKSFPSNPWVPYKLSWLDLSHNKIPELTDHFTYGTKKVVYLDLSYNTINEIRKGVIGNFTAVKHLDLSHNELAELTKAVFNVPENLTYLSLSHNSLTTLPVSRLGKLRYLDVSYNQIESILADIVALAKNGSEVLYGGNPIICDCSVRPLKRWLDSRLQSHWEPAWNDLRCSSPPQLKDHVLVNTVEEELSCADQEESEMPDQELLPTPDILFREPCRLDASRALHLRWLVNKKDDISEFKVLARESGDMGGILKSTTLSYDVRSTVVKNLNSDKAVEVCIQTLDSFGRDKEIKEGQCCNYKFKLGAAAQSGCASIRPVTGHHILVTTSVVITLYKIFLSCCFLKEIR